MSNQYFYTQWGAKGTVPCEAILIFHPRPTRREVFSVVASIESFVERLKQDGIDAGQTQADRIIAEAKAKAETMVAEAEALAQKRLSEAQAQAAIVLERGKSELALAARDIQARLRERLQNSMAAILKQAAQNALADPQVLAKAIAEIARALATTKGSGDIELKDADQVKKMALALLGAQAPALESLRLSDGRTQPGFRFRSAQGGTIELDPSSVTEHLMNLCGPAVTAILKEETQ